MATNNYKTSLAEGLNKVYIEGTLVEKKMELATTESGNNVIRGSVIVTTDGEDRHEVFVYANEKTSNGEVSKSYANLLTVYNSYVSQVDVSTTGGDPSTVAKIYLIAKFSVRDYWSTRTEKMVCFPVLRCNFIGKVKNEFKPRAEFECMPYFETITPEVVEEIPTGRIKVDCILPIYNGQIIPLTFFTTLDKTNGDIGAYIMKNYSTGKTGRIEGKIETVVKKTVTATNGFGTSTEKVFESVRTEYIITGGDAEQLLITDPKSYDKETIKKAMVLRNEYLAEKEAKGRESADSTPTTSFSGGFGTTSTRTAPAVVPNTEDW